MKLNLKNLLTFLDEIDSEGKWIIPSKVFKLIYNGKLLNKKLKDFVKAGLLIRLNKSFYANIRAKSRNEFFLQEFAKYIRPNDIFYESLESMASEFSLISQVPNRITFITNKRSYIYYTPIGIIEFTHKNFNYDDFQELINKKLIFYDEEKKIYCGTEELVKEDLVENKRCIDLIYEEDNRVNANI